MHDDYPKDFQDAASFHGHVCPGLAIGYRVAKIAMDRLNVQRSGDEELVAMVETDACAVDAVQYLLGCTIGKGNLIYKDHGKHVFTVVDREHDRAVRVAMRPSTAPRPPEIVELSKKVFGGGASEEEQRRFQDYQDERIHDILHNDAETLFKIEDVAPSIPERARIFPSLTCEFCGESVMEPRARLREGKTACIPCAEEYSRGW